MKTKLIISPTAKQISEIFNFERKKYMSNKPIIVIDPGHGGKEKVGGSSPNNAVGANGLLEKNLTLDIANRVVKSLANQADVFMTRTSDTNLGLAARAKVAKDKNASLFLSIHFNGFEDTKVDGTEVWVAKDANSAGKKFAETLLEKVVDSTKVKNRGVRQGNLGVLLPDRHSSATSACLLEVSFLSNPTQARELENDTYKQTIANSIISAVRQHFSLSATAQSLFYDSRVSLSLDKPKKTLDEIAQEMGYSSKADYVGKEVKSATLFGLSVGGGLHPDFYKKLQQAETKAKAMITPTPTTAADWGVRNISGYQADKKGGYHPWGLAIDIDYAENPYIMHEDGEAVLDKLLEPVYHRISRFIVGRTSVIPKDMFAGKKSVGDMYDLLKAESDAMKRYFKLMQDSTLLLSEIQKYYDVSDPTFWERIWGIKDQTPSIDTIQQIMMRDYVILAGEDGPSITGKTYPTKKDVLKGTTGDVPFDDKGKLTTRKPENGFLTIRKELVLALTGEGLRWGAMHFGGASGDVMHFDDGKSGTLALKIAAIKNAPAKAKSQSFNYSDNYYSQPFGGTFVEKDVAWAVDHLSPDYNHLGETVSATPFEFTATKLSLLCDANSFNVKTNEKDPRDEVLFGLRGCILADGKESSGGFVDKVLLVEAVPNHKECKCVIGVWKRSTNKIAVFIGSTVPNWSGMKKQLDDPKKLNHCNMRPTGKYKHKVGTHRAGDALEIKGAIKEDEKVPAIRSIDNLIYEITDLWTFGTPGDNIHPTRTTKPTEKFSSEGCITVLGTYDKSSEKHAGLWSEFRNAAGLTATKAPTSEDNREFIFVLLTGREARLISPISPATKKALTRLRFGSSGVDVEALQLMLSTTQRKDKTKGTYYTGTKDGNMGAGTVQAYTDWQFDGEGFRDGIVTPLDGKSLGIDIVNHLSLSKKVWNPRMMLYEDWFLKPNLKPKAEVQEAKSDYYTAKAGTSYNVRPDILVTAKVELKMEELAKKVYDDTNPHHKITYSSGYRGPDRQAKAMYDKIVKDADAFDIYKAKDLAKEIKQAYLDNKSKGEADTVAKMKEVIEKQVKDGKYISNHLVSGAADISSVDKDYYDKIRKFAKEMGMKNPLDEGDHLHVEF
jgi:N-acetylmuramoyl-L-alanine amidase